MRTTLKRPAHLSAVRCPPPARPRVRKRPAPAGSCGCGRLTAAAHQQPASSHHHCMLPLRSHLQHQVGKVSRRKVGEGYRIASARTHSACREQLQATSACAHRCLHVKRAALSMACLKATKTTLCMLRKALYNPPAPLLSAKHPAHHLPGCLCPARPHCPLAQRQAQAQGWLLGQRWWPCDCTAPCDGPHGHT